MSRVSDALAPFRETLQADGADVEVKDYDGGVLRLRLNIDSASCIDCVLPKAMLEEAILHGLRKHLPDVKHVEVDDPRTDADAPA